MHGVDLSNNNGGALIPAEAEWALFKVTEATTFTDATCADYVTAATARALPYGGYHFAHPDVNSADAEAAHFLAHVPVPATLPAALDVETRGSGAQHRDPLAIMGPTRLGAWVDRWCSLVGAATGRAPLLYTFRSYATALVPHCQPWPLWLSTLDGTILSSWAGRAVTVCQYAIIDGIDRNVDLVPIVAPPPVPYPPTPKDDPMPQALIHRDSTGREWVFSVGADHVTRYHVDGQLPWTALGGLWSSLIGVTEYEPGHLTLTGYGMSPPDQVWRVVDDGTAWGAPFTL
jgi:lysozyme